LTGRSSGVAFRQMLEHAREAFRFVGARRREDLDEDRLLNLAVVRLLEVVGEAAARVPGDEQARHPEVPWREIVGLRNRLIHGYDEVDFDVVWAIIQSDLPPLIRALEAIVRGLPPE